MATPLLRIKGVTKRFPGVTALCDVNFELNKGEIHALVGANGAGKSTLIKVLAGAYQPDEGILELKGKAQKFSNPMDARRRGISVIYQEFTLFPDMDVAKNIFFGNEPQRGPLQLVDWAKVYRESAQLLKHFSLDLDVQSKVSSLSIAQQQMVEIAKALSRDTQVLIMDEPTATLTMDEVERLFKIVANLKEQGVSIIYISHRLEEVMRISDCFTVLRNGTVVGSMPTREADKKKMIQMMVGDYMPTGESKDSSSCSSEIAFQADNLSTATMLKNISFTVNCGEVVGLAGLVGAGRTELARAIFGADPIISGVISVHRKKVKISSPADAIGNGIGLLPESRKTQGLFMNMNVRRNITYASLVKFLKGLFISKSKERVTVSQYIQSLKIKTPSTEFSVFNLSGGNQQKIALCKWLCTDCNVLILDEPTRGIDIGAKEEMFQVIDALAKQGKSIIFISSELEEVIRVSDRILTMYKGRITGELTREEASMEKIMYFITGGDGD